MLWETAGEPLKKEIQVSNLDVLKVHQGYKIEGSSNPAGWEFSFSAPDVKVRALWSFDDSQPDPSEMLYLGPVPDRNGTEWALAETRPGWLVELPSIPAGIRHLAHIDGRDFENKLPPDQVLEDTSTSYKRRTESSRRSVLLLGRQLMTGHTISDLRGDGLLLRDVRMKLFPKGNDLYGLRREFLLSIAPSSISKRANRALQDTGRNWEEVLEKYLQTPANDPKAILPAIKIGADEVLLERGAQEVRVLSDDEPRRWTLRAHLAQDHGQYVLDTNYSESASVRLFRSAGGVKASFRKVPSLTAEEYKRHLSVEHNRPVDIGDERLYYVKGVKVNESTGETYPETHHLFEMGYGKTLLVPESQLEYNGGPFDQVEMLLAFGDAIGWITFKEKKDEKSGADLVIININETDLQYSHAHHLYEQGTKYQMVHPLHLSYDGGTVKIKYVEGLDKRQVVKEQPAFYGKVEAHLTDVSKARLGTRIQDWEGRTGREPVVLGRLDAARFKSTFGREVYFEHVRLSFEASAQGEPLKPGDRLFLKARNIRRSESGNEYFLGLAPPNYVSPEDVGRDFREARLELQRRAFSVRENLLKRILNSVEGAGGLSNRLLLVRLYMDKKGRIMPGLRSGAPSRKVSALAGVINQEKLLYAAVSEVEASGAVQVELNPGIFVRLTRNQISDRPADLREGAIVRIENAQAGQRGKDYYFRITYAAFSDAHYVPAKTRLAVALPKNNLLDSRERESADASKPYFWQQKGFTVGGLPNISASLAKFDVGQGRWYPPMVEDFVELMKTEHPKVVRLGEDSPDEFHIDTVDGVADVVGSIHVAADSFNVKFVPLHAWPDDPRCLPLSWRNLTFADEPVRAIIERAELESWRFHDAETGTWLDDGSIPRQPLDDHNAWTGPLFFERYGKSMRLRYGAGNFLAFGCPVEELIGSLRARHPGGYTFNVAGVSRSGDGGLWIEIGPGRIAELPAHVVVWKSWAKVKSLAELNWEDFAPGDRVELELVSDNPFMIDRIALKKWVPGPRKAFGPKRAFLPVKWADKCDGALIIGWGGYQLTYPIARPNPKWLEVILYADNELEALSTPERKHDSGERHDAKPRLPEAGDVILLSEASLLNPRNPKLLIVLGLPDYKPEPAPSAAADFETDPILNNIITSKGEALSINFGRLRELISAAGGSLPITVEGVDSEARTLFFSRRHQRAKGTLPTGRVSPAHVTGKLNYRTALLRYGGKLIKLDIDEVISGLREPLFNIAVEALRESGTVVWLRGTEDGHVTVGLPAEQGDELIVEAEASLSRDMGGGKEETGLICRDTESMKLYWLPGKEAAWAPLSQDQLQDIFKDKGAFKVQLMTEHKRSPEVSVIALPEARKEFSDLTVGKGITVKVLKRRLPADGNRSPVFVESYHTKVVLTCDPYGESLTENADVLMEVIQRNVEPQRLIIVAPRGRKPLELDLPQWMTGCVPEAGQRRDELSKYLRWSSERPEIKQFDKIKLGEADDEIINKLLCYAYSDGHPPTPEALMFKISVAEQWATRNRRAREVFVPYAIMAILLLDKFGSEVMAAPMRLLPQNNPVNLKSWASDWRSQASTLTQQLGARALRSSHVEVLSRKWLLNESSRELAADLWGRLRVIESYLGKGINTQSIREIRQFCKAVELRNQEGLLPISQGLFASLGEVSDMTSLLAFAEQMRELVEIFRTLPTSKTRIWLKQAHKERLRKVLRSINRDALDLTVLDPIPTTEKLDVDGKAR